MFARRPEQYRRTRTVLAALTLLALLGFWLFPTAPPRLLTGMGLHDVVATYSNWGWWSSTDSAPPALSSIAHQYAAFPSLHIAWAMWCGATLWRYAKGFAARVGGAMYPVVTALVILGTANHYVLDVLAGVALWWACDLTASYAVDRRLRTGSLRWTARR